MLCQVVKKITNLLPNRISSGGWIQLIFKLFCLCQVYLFGGPMLYLLYSTSPLKKQILQLIYSTIISNCFILFRVAVDSESQEYWVQSRKTLQRTMHTNIHKLMPQISREKIILATLLNSLLL